MATPSWGAHQLPDWAKVSQIAAAGVPLPWSQDPREQRLPCIVQHFFHFLLFLCFFFFVTNQGGESNAKKCCTRRGFLNQRQDFAQRAEPAIPAITSRKSVAKTQGRNASASPPPRSQLAKTPVGLIDERCYSHCPTIDTQGHRPPSPFI